MGWMRVVHRLPEGANIPLYARLRRGEGWGEWRLVGELRREAARVEVRFDERNALCRPVWAAAAAANDNGYVDDRGVVMAFAAAVTGEGLVELGQAQLASSLVSQVRGVVDARKEAYRRGLKGRAHSDVRSSWPDASRLAPRGKQRKGEPMAE